MLCKKVKFTDPASANFIMFETQSLNTVPITLFLLNGCLSKVIAKHYIALRCLHVRVSFRVFQTYQICHHQRPSNPLHWWSAVSVQEQRAPSSSRLLYNMKWLHISSAGTSKVLWWHAAFLTRPSDFCHSWHPKIVAEVVTPCGPATMVIWWHEFEPVSTKLIKLKFVFSLLFQCFEAINPTVT